VKAGWPRVVLLIAAAWNLIGGTMALLDPARQAQQLFHASDVTSTPAHEFFVLCTWINVLAWGLAYLIAAFQPSARVPVMLAGGIGKLAYAAVCFSLVVAGRGAGALLVSGIVDTVLASLLLAGAWPRRTAR
jgi:hypothetical protein